VGLGIAALLGVGFYRGSRRVNLRTFFRWTGIALIFIAAGLLSRAVHEFVEIGWITAGTSTAVDLSSVLPHEAIAGAPTGIALLAGQFLQALLGYTSRPEVVTLLVWVTYVTVVLTLFLRPVAARPVPVAAPVREGGQAA
jgi:high-affinity iron transporter